MHFTRHAVAVRVRERKKRRTPTKIALTVLVAVMPTAKRINANSAVPKVPINKVKSGAQQPELLRPVVLTKVRARYPTAIPKATQRNAGVTVITPVICKNAAIIPTNALAITAINVQLHE